MPAAAPTGSTGTPAPSPKSEKKSKTPALDHFCRDLTQLAGDGALDPTIGRQKEIERVMEILSRRKKNNPVLIGEPGVGKTAIVEGLAQLIAGGQCPDALKDHRVLSLDMAAASSRSGSRRSSTRSRRTRISSCSSASCTRWWAPAPPKAPWTPPTCSSPRWRAASCSAWALRP
jgi:ATP-dependent Clp protease ATP-binding subunit ClpA